MDLGGFQGSSRAVFSRLWEAYGEGRLDDALHLIDPDCELRVSVTRPRLSRSRRRARGDGRVPAGLEERHAHLRRGHRGRPADHRRHRPCDRLRSSGTRLYDAPLVWMAAFSKGRLQRVTSYSGRAEALAAAAEARQAGRLDVRAGAIQQRRLPTDLGALRRRARAGDPRAPRPGGRVAPLLVDPASYHGHAGVRTWAVAVAQAWKSVTVVLDEQREVDGCVVASGRIAAFDYGDEQVVDSVLTCVAEFRYGRDRARVLVLLRRRRAGVGQRAPRAALASASASSRVETSPAKRASAICVMSSPSSGPRAMPSAAASSSPRTRGGWGPRHAAPAPRPAPRGPARGAARWPPRPCARASPAGRRR